MSFLHELFPNSKFVYMIRDGRDAAYSYFVREKEAYKLKNMNINTYLERWDKMNEKADAACSKMAVNVCHRVRYENLVTNPELVLRQLLEFLNLKWTDDLLRHEQLVEQKKLSISNDPIYKKFPRNKKINKSSIGKWRKGNVSELKDEKFLSKFPMLKKLNYTD